MEAVLDQRPDQRRSLNEALDSAWQVLLALPRSQLAMLPADLLDAHGAARDPRATR